LLVRRVGLGRSLVVVAAACSVGTVGIASAAAGPVAPAELLQSTTPAPYNQVLPGDLPAPTSGKTANLQVAEGAVLIRVPTSEAFVRLTASQAIPLGTVVDATDGVAVVTLANADGSLYTGRFWGGVFQVRQGTGAFPVATMVLRDDLAGKTKSRKKNRLWGDAQGKFKTTGEGGSASVRSSAGAKYLVTDFTDGTSFKVSRGSIWVRDFDKHETIVLKAGRAYFIPKAADAK
jgi:hypothetical protein